MSKDLESMFRTNPAIPTVRRNFRVTLKSGEVVDVIGTICSTFGENVLVVMDMQSAEIGAPVFYAAAGEWRSCQRLEEGVV